MDYGSHTRLVYEQMLASRHALQNAPAHGRDWVLDRSATVLLSRLEVQGAMSVGELAGAFGLDVSTIHRQVAAAMKADLIERIPDPAGGQAKKHRPTQEGMRRLHAELNDRAATLSRVTEDWKEGEVETLILLLGKYNRSMEKLHGQQWPRPYSLENPNISEAGGGVY